MSTNLKSLWNVGKITADVFARAGVSTVDEARNCSMEKVQQVINTLKGEKPDKLEKYWKNLTSRCNDVIYRCRTAEAKPIEPEHLCCPITFDLFKEPVVTPSGHSYEKCALLEHLKTFGTDPFTRAKLESEQLYPNYALVEAVANFKKNDRLYSMFT
ncbi:hypothetical protein BKA69DRAFT_1038387 [Paraphysoderma sedebokerense]|nr:hypothetical protein BKA69DRAFT_1038387 [Paraphysoderma sedebokerense]